jgi:hypothetical protein
VSSSSYSQRIRTIGQDTFVTFSREQAKAINDTFVYQKQTISKLKTKDSLMLTNINYLNKQDSTHRVKDSLIYFEQILPALKEIKQLLVAQVETPFKRNIEIGVGAGVSTYFGEYRPFSQVINGKYYIPSGVGILKYNYQKHLTLRFEAIGTNVSAELINRKLVMGTILADYNIAPNMCSIKVGMIPSVSVGYTIFGLTNAIIAGAGIKSYFTDKTALEINIRHTLTNIDNAGNSDNFIFGHLIITRKIL